MKYFLPLGIFVALTVLFALGLQNNPREVPSQFINKPAPPFDLPSLLTQQRIQPAQFKGDIWLLNVWASWCAACLEEHEELSELITSQQLTSVGLNYKDNDIKAKAWLRRWGNPFQYIAVDTEGVAGLDWGVYGVPETFIIDHQGKVRLKHIGNLKPQHVQDKILPLLQQLRQEAGLS